MFYNYDLLTHITVNDKQPKRHNNKPTSHSAVLTGYWKLLIHVSTALFISNTGVLISP
jgi:hypothetical protein